MKKYQSFILCILMAPTVWGQDFPELLDEALREKQEKSHLPGIAMVIVSKDSLLYQKGFGYADVKRKKPFRPQTLIRVCSISKTFVALAIMKLIDQKKLRLDAPINELLPFPVVHPHHPDVPITLWHLVTHTSGIQDSYWDFRRGFIMEEKFKVKKKHLFAGYEKHAAFFNENTLLSIPEFLENLMSPEGPWYHPEQCFMKEAPGQKYKYSNTGSSLAAYIVEIVAGESFAKFTQREILDPLGMQHSGWFHEDVDMDNFAQLYFHNGNPIPLYHLIPYPVGGLLTSVADLSLYLQEMMKGFEGEGTLLSQESYRQMFRVQFEGGDRPGVFWDIGQKTISHNGGDQGCYALLSFHKQDKVGKILVTNTNAHWFDELEEEFNALWKTMYQYQSYLLPE